MQIYCGTYNGRVLLLQGTPSQLRLKTAKQLSENSIRAITYSNDQVIIGGFDQEIRALNRSTCEEIKQSKDSKGIIMSMCDINARLMAVGLQNGTLRFWNKQHWGIHKDIRQHKKPINDMKVDSNGKLLVSVAGKQMMFWNLNTLKSVYRFRFQHEIEKVILQPNFQYLFLISSHVVRQLATEDNQELSKWESTQKVQTALIFRNFLILGTQKGIIKIFTQGMFTHCMHFEAHTVRIKDMKQVQYQDSSYLVTADSSGEVKVWDILEFLKQVQTISQDYPLQGLKPLSSVQTGERIICIEVNSMQKLQKNAYIQVDRVENESKNDKKLKKNKQKNKIINKPPKTKKIRQ